MSPKTVESRTLIKPYVPPKSGLKNIIGRLACVMRKSQVWQWTVRFSGKYSQVTISGNVAFTWNFNCCGWRIYTNSCYI